VVRVFVKAADPAPFFVRVSVPELIVLEITIFHAKIPFPAPVIAAGVMVMVLSVCIVPAVTAIPSACPLAAA
jgi:hypothetical protein